MAKKAQQTTKSTAVAKAAPGGLPAHIAKARKAEAESISKDASDYLIPMYRILQPLSPEVNKRGATYVKDAEPGDIYSKNGVPPLIKGETGFLFQPCYVQRAVVEWLPREKGGGGGGGFVTLHNVKTPSEIPGAIQVPHPQDPTKKMWIVKATKNTLMETRYHGGYIITDDGALPAIIPFSSSGHSVAKGWNMLMASKGPGVEMWFAFYRFTKKMKTVGPNTWSIFEITDAGPKGETMWAPEEADLERGETLYKQMSSGLKGFDASEAGGDDTHSDRM